MAYGKGTSRCDLCIDQKGGFARDFDLRNQIKASAGSVMDNIAEGFERNSSKEFSQFLVIAKGSNGEVRSRLYRACDRGYVNQEFLAERQDYSNVLGRKIKAFIDYLGSSKYKGKPQKKD